MSTKSSLKCEDDQTTGQRFHLYEEVFDEGNIYLEHFLFKSLHSLAYLP